MISLEKRSNENNTHENIVDDSIKEITCYKLSLKKRLLSLLLEILTLGILFIISYLSVKVYLYLNCIPSEASDCDYFLVIDSDKNFNLCKTNRKNYLEGLDNKEKNEVISSEYIGDEKHNQNDSNIVKINYLNQRFLNTEIIFTFF